MRPERASVGRASERSIETSLVPKLMASRDCESVSPAEMTARVNPRPALDSRCSEMRQRARYLRRSSVVYSSRLRSRWQIAIFGGGHWASSFFAS